MAKAAHKPDLFSWHSTKVASVRASLLRGGQRRLEAESYLADGYGIRQSIESKTEGWVRFEKVATASAPPRIKQVLVSPEHGVPYLNTSQVFDLRPKPRKWLAMEKTSKGAARLVKEGTILVMASATVGRSIVATKAHENTVISHHFMRVVPLQDELSGWVYAFLRSPQGLAMMKGSQYASVIRHIEPHHLASLPIPTVSPEVARDFAAQVSSITSARNKSSELRQAAEDLFEDAVGLPTSEGTQGFSVRLQALSAGRRRFEATYHTPEVQGIIGRFKKHEPLAKLSKRVWWGKRFKRHFGESGIPYLSADDVFTTNAYALQRILVSPDDNHENFFVEPGWLLMACSGQTYGLNGSATLATEWHKNTFFSHDLIRIEPSEAVRPGYLLTALTHPKLGRPLLIREAYGMSIPHLDPGDVASFPVVRLDPDVETRIAELHEGAVEAQSRAEVLERGLSEAAGAVISDFLLHDR